jgi:putative ABC transport system permease protein
VAADVNLLETLKGEVRTGRFIDASTEDAPVLVLGSVTAERLGLGPSDLGMRVRVGDRWFTVVGILQPFPLAPDLDRAAIVGYPAAERYLGGDGIAGAIHVRAEAENIDAVSAVLPATVDPESPNEVQVSRPSDVLEARSATETAFTDLFLGLGAVALLVGGVGIANVMVISVLERRREIGLRRAVGATRAHVGSQFLVEALLLSALGGLGGIVLGVGVTAGYAVLNDAAVLVPLTAVLGGLGAAVAVGAVAGLYPALRAARLTPTEALRTG